MGACEMAELKMHYLEIGRALSGSPSSAAARKCDIFALNLKYKMDAELLEYHKH